MTAVEFLVQLREDYRFIHFGCHGSLQTSSAPGSIKDLPDSNSVPQSSAQGVQPRSGPDEAHLQLWQDNLHARQLLEHFSPKTDHQLTAQLVFLSACETQVTEAESLRYGGNTLKALGTAFLVAGAQNVVASHWSVNSSSTEQLTFHLMRQLHNKLLNEPSSHITSEDLAIWLHEGRKALSRDQDYRRPFEWGPFTLSTLPTPSAVSQ